jgi:hypothetical protein
LVVRVWSGDDPADGGRLLVGMSPHARQFAVGLGATGCPILGWYLGYPFMLRTVRPPPSPNLPPVSPACLRRGRSGDALVPNVSQRRHGQPEPQKENSP